MSPWKALHPSRGHRPGRKHYFRITTSVCRAEQRFSVKGKIVNISGFWGPGGLQRQYLSECAWL